MLRLRAGRLRREAHRIEGAEEDVAPGIPIEQANDESPPGLQDLSWDQHHALDEGAESHADDAPLLIGVLRLPTRVDRQDETDPPR